MNLTRPPGLPLPLPSWTLVTASSAHRDGALQPPPAPLPESLRNFRAKKKNPCILFATTQGCWRGDGCEFGHSYASSEKKCRRPRKETREKIKERIRMCFEINIDPEQIYLDLQEEAHNNEYAFTLIVGYLDSLDSPVRRSGRWVFCL